MTAGDGHRGTSSSSSSSRRRGSRGSRHSTRPNTYKQRPAYPNKDGAAAESRDADTDTPDTPAGLVNPQFACGRVMIARYRRDGARPHRPDARAGHGLMTPHPGRRPPLAATLTMRRLWRRGADMPATFHAACRRGQPPGVTWPYCPAHPTGSARTINHSINHQSICSPETTHKTWSNLSQNLSERSRCPLPKPTRRTPAFNQSASSPKRMQPSGVGKAPGDPPAR